MKLGEGLVGWAAFTREPVLVADVSTDPATSTWSKTPARARHPDVDQGPLHRVFDLESPE
jgi:hypothetical protein